MSLPPASHDEPNNQLPYQSPSSSSPHNDIGSHSPNDNDDAFSPQHDSNYHYEEEEEGSSPSTMHPPITSSQHHNLSSRLWSLKPFNTQTISYQQHQHQIPNIGPQQQTTPSESNSSKRLQSYKSLLKSLLGPTSQPILLKHHLPTLQNQISKASEDVLSLLVYNMYPELKKAGERQKTFGDASMPSILGNVDAARRRGIGIGIQQMRRRQEMQNPSSILRSTALSNRDDLYIQTQFIQKVKWILRHEKDQKVSFLWLWIDLNGRVLDILKGSSTVQELDWRRWHRFMIADRVSLSVLQAFLKQFSAREKTEAAISGKLQPSSSSSDTFPSNLDKFTCIKHWNRSVFSLLFESILKCDLDKRVALLLRNSLVQWMESFFPLEEKHTSPNHHFTNSPAAQNEIFVLAEYLKRKWKFLVKGFGRAPVSQTQVLEGFFLSQGKASDSMPSGLQGKMGLIVIQDSQDSDETDQHDSNANDSLDDDESSTGSLTIRVKSREMLQQLQRDKMLKIQHFVQLLLQHGVRMVVVQKHIFDTQCLATMARANIVCVQNVNGEELQHLKEHFGIEPISMFGLQYRHPFVFYPPQELNVETQVAWVKSFRQFNFGQGDVASHLVPLQKEKQCSTLVLRAPMTKIATQYADILFKCVANICHDESFSSSIKEVNSLRERNGETDLDGAHTKENYDPYALYILPGSGYPEKVVADELDHLAQAFSTADKDDSIVWQDVNLTAEQRVYLQAFAISFRELGSMLPDFSSLCTLNRQMHLLHLVLNEV